MDAVPEEELVRVSAEGLPFRVERDAGIRGIGKPESAGRGDHFVQESEHVETSDLDTERALEAQKCRLKPGVELGGKEARGALSRGAEKPDRRREGDVRRVRHEKVARAGRV